ncbi:MAG: hypothetical protein ACQEUZ_13425 [Pseudomonadota bacterium]
MQIDWLTVAAQVVNFLVLVWLLRRFLYGPITRAMAAREERIESRLAEARAKRDEATRRTEDLEAERQELEDQRQRMLEEVREEARELREKLERELREEIAGKREDWRDRLAGERQAFLQALRRRASRHAFNMLRQLLDDFADADLSERVAARFVEHLEGLDDDTRRKLAEAARQAGGKALVETASDLPSGVRSQLTRALHEAVSPDLEPEYRAAEDVALGARLTIGARVLDWTAARHIDRLEQRVEAEFDALRRGGGGQGSEARPQTRSDEASGPQERTG